VYPLGAVIIVTVIMQFGKSPDPEKVAEEEKNQLSADN